jgi:hypothetical protein
MSYAGDQLGKLRDRTLVFLKDRSTAYRLAFGSPAGQLVLDDLAQFCHANKSVWNENQRLTDVAIGHHEVFLRILQHLNLNPEQLLTMYNGQHIQDALAKLKEEEDDNG